MSDYPRRNPNPKSPGVSGAIKDALSAVNDYVVGSTARDVADSKRRRIDAAIDGTDTSRMREGQSTDSNNDY